MKPVICNNCQEEISIWGEFCPGCGEPIENYSRPAGFWIRFGAQIIDSLIFIPVIVLSFWNLLSLKSIGLMILLGLIGLVYKPFMEAFFGATVGKMACGIKVINDKGEKLSLSSAYIRFLPFLAASALTLVGQYFFYSSPGFQSVTSFVELSQMQQNNPQDIVGLVLNVVVIIDCICAAFTFRKRALHDMLADSFCVYKES